MASELDIFSFWVAKDPVPFERYLPAARRVNRARSGKKHTLVRGDVLEFKAEYIVAFPQPPTGSVLDFTDMLLFVDDHKALSFLVMPYTGPSMRTETALAVTDGTTKDFALLHKHIDTGLIKVYLDGVLQESGWSVVDNNTAPKVRWVSAPATGQTHKIVAPFYVPCIMLNDPLDEGEGLADPGTSDTTDTPRSFTFEFAETEPGARFVNATGMRGA